MEPDIQEKVIQWRIKAEAGTLSLSEMREAIAYLRGGRLQANKAAKERGISKKVVNSADLLSELEAL
jgi:hypothetical protein